MKKLLEDTYDIPFHVIKCDEGYLIYPQNDLEELFEIKISFQSGVRLIIEIYPQKHAAAMLNDMAVATEEKKLLFRGYLGIFLRKNLKLRIYVNEQFTDLKDWPVSWRSLNIRISGIVEQDADFNNIASEVAVLATGMMLSLLNVIPVEGYADGDKVKLLTNRYERNPLNRELCIKIHGYSCKICGMNFQERYGGIGKNFIHVHHIEPVSMMERARILHPEKDLIPVCPNCHAMLHTSSPPLLPEELIKILKEKHPVEEY